MPLYVVRYPVLAHRGLGQGDGLALLRVHADQVALAQPVRDAQYAGYGKLRAVAQRADGRVAHDDGLYPRQRLLDGAHDPHQPGRVAAVAPHRARLGKLVHRDEPVVLAKVPHAGPPQLDHRSAGAENLAHVVDQLAHVRARLARDAHEGEALAALQYVERVYPPCARDPPH